jgi:hypothetical protein
MSTAVIDNVTQSYFVFVSLLSFIIAFVPLLGILGILLYWLSLRLLNYGPFIRRHRMGYVGIEDDGTDPDAYCDRVVNPQAYPTAPSRRLVNCNSPVLNGDGE